MTKDPESLAKPARARRAGDIGWSIVAIALVAATPWAADVLWGLWDEGTTTGWHLEAAYAQAQRDAGEAYLHARRAWGGLLKLEWTVAGVHAVKPALVGFALWGVVRTLHSGARGRFIAMVMWSALACLALASARAL